MNMESHTVHESTITVFDGTGHGTAVLDVL